MRSFREKLADVTAGAVLLGFGGAAICGAVGLLDGENRPSYTDITQAETNYSHGIDQLAWAKKGLSELSATLGASCVGVLDRADAGGYVQYLESDNSRECGESEQRKAEAWRLYKKSSSEIDWAAQNLENTESKLKHIANDRDESNIDAVTAWAKAGLIGGLCFGAIVGASLKDD